MKKGISLVALVITIIVLIILTTVVILSVTNGGIINKSNEAVFKSDVRNFQEELQRNILNLQMNMKIQSKDEIGSENPIDNTTNPNIKSYIKSITNKYEDKFVIYKGELCYLEDKLTEEEIQWCIDLGLNEYLNAITLNFKDIYNEISEDEREALLYIEGEKYSIDGAVMYGAIEEKYPEQYYKLIIPNEIDGKKLTNIASIDYCDSFLKEIEFESGIKEIEELSIESCDNLSNIIFPNSIHLVYLHIYDCNDLKSLSIPNGTKNMSIEECNSLTKVDLPNSVSNLAIGDCNKLQSITIPNNVEYLNISNCNSLLNLTVSSNVINLGIMYCEKIENVVILGGDKAGVIQNIYGLANLRILDLPDRMRFQFTPYDILNSNNLEKIIVESDEYKQEMISYVMYTEYENIVREKVVVKS